MVSVCVLCGVFCVCVQEKALRRADHPSKESYRPLPTVLELVNRSETESFMETAKA
jgi:hypothetical protein